MPVRRRKDESHENLERWLLTYADLITLLLAFFVVMYSMSQVDAKKFGKMAEALNGVLKGGDNLVQSATKNQKTGHGVLKLGDLAMIQQSLQEKFGEFRRTQTPMTDEQTGQAAPAPALGPQSEIETEITERGLVVHILESALFRVGSADLEPRAVEILQTVGSNLKDLPNHVRIEGHTDDRPINTARFPSNWELSSARATSVVRFFIDSVGISADRISALGYGEFRPVVPNVSIENRSRNRRVDIVVLTMEMTMKEPTARWYYDPGEIVTSDSSFPGPSE